MENKRIEDLLLDINEKLKNRNTFSWKWWFGWLIIIPFILVGFVLITTAGYYNNDQRIVGCVIIFIGFLMVLINWIQGIIALYRSTKHYFVFKNDKERDFSFYLRNIKTYSLDSIKERVGKINKISGMLNIDIWEIKDSKQIYSITQKLETYYNKKQINEQNNSYATNQNSLPIAFDEDKASLEEYKEFLEYEKK